MKQLLLTLALLAVQLASAQTADYDTNRGFIHPGGLHTQADFDRVKAQLEAGNPTVKEAYRVLTSAAYSQSGVQTNPVEVIVRGGGSGENYMNACRGAAMAYQNALRWKIAGTKANANAAVRILMAWANTTKDISGDSNYALASGLYGYQFAQAAELMRDYEGWEREDFELFKRWMLQVWYSKALGFLRGRNGTWENQGKWWQAPGHYWSNWGLCNALCVAMIGILCDDVFIYNQAMSYFKYDQCGTFRENRTDVPIKNDGLTEFLGNLVVTMVNSDLETGAYGYLGQMNESGRDTGHSAMALGLAVDLAKVGWNQGDDLFAYMNHRLAAGIEYVAAQTQSVANLPWTNYQYGSSGYYYTDSRAWTMTEPAMGAQMRPYWGTVIGIYEGVKGVTMPFAEQAYTNMGIDGGGEGSTSGGYDHLGFSVLMNTRDVQLCPANQVPTELTPKMEYSGTLSTSLIPSLTQEKTRKLIDGKIVYHNELGGLVNRYDQIGGAVPNGGTLTLSPQLPDDEQDTGNWSWNTGEQTREITVSTDKSYIYRVTYTNSRGVESQLCFPIACEGDGTAMPLNPEITVGDVTYKTDTLCVLYGTTVKLQAKPIVGGGKYKWSTTGAGESKTLSKLKEPTTISVTYTHTNGVKSEQTFRLGVCYVEPYITLDGAENEGSELVCDAGSNVTLGVRLPSGVDANSVTWSNGTTGTTLAFDDITTTTEVSASFVVDGHEVEQRFIVFVRETDKSRMVEPGYYVLQHVATGRLMTAHAKGDLVTFEDGDVESPAHGQLWYVNRQTTPKYRIMALPDSLYINSSAKMAISSTYAFSLWGAEGSDRLALYSGSTASVMKFWDIDTTGNVVLSTGLSVETFPFRLITSAFVDGIGEVENEKMRNSENEVYDLSGRKIVNSQIVKLNKGVYIRGGKTVVIK